MVHVEGVAQLQIRTSNFGNKRILLDI